MNTKETVHLNTWKDKCVAYERTTSEKPSCFAFIVGRCMGWSKARTMAVGRAGVPHNRSAAAVVRSMDRSIAEAGRCCSDPASQHDFDAAAAAHVQDGHNTAALQGGAAACTCRWPKHRSLAGRSEASLSHSLRRPENLALWVSRCAGKRSWTRQRLSARGWT